MVCKMWLKKPNCNRCNKTIEKEQEYAVVHCKSGKKIIIHFSCLHNAFADLLIPPLFKSFRKIFKERLKNLKTMISKFPSEKEIEGLKP